MNGQSGEKFGWVWVPMEYTTDQRPGIILYTEETKYRLDLKELYNQPILEGMVFVKINGENVAFLAQIAVDPFDLEAKGYQIDKSNFTGTILKSDWDDTPIEGTNFVNGEIESVFSNAGNSLSGVYNSSIKARTQSCWKYVEATSVHADSSGVTVHGYNKWVNVCDGGFGGGWGGSGSGTGGDYGSGGTSSTGGGGGYVPSNPTSTPGGVYWDPLVNSGGGAMNPVYHPSVLYPFDIKKAAAGGGTDRLNMNANLAKTLSALGLTSSLTGWSYDKGAALAKSIGGNANKHFPVATALGRSFGAVGAVVGVYQVYVGLSKDGFTWDKDGWNIANATLGIAAVAITGANAIWLVPTLGAISIGISVYTLAKD